MSPASILTPTFLTILSTFHLFPLHAPITMFALDAPHGKHSINSRLNINGKFAWWSMEIVSPATCLATLAANHATLSRPTLLLLALYLLHYLNRSTISVLRSNAMAPNHLSTWSSAVGFNLANGYLLGSYLSTNPTGSSHLAFSNPIYWAGVLTWVVGWSGNVVHDEILLSLRRRSSPPTSSSSSPKSHGPSHSSSAISTTLPATSTSKERTYYLPYQLGFRFILFPHYLCELIEWTGWAVACSSPLLYLWSRGDGGRYGAGGAFFQPGATAQGWRLLTPAWVFVLNMTATLIPRAVGGRRWYVEKFGAEKVGEGRKAILPGLL